MSSPRLKFICILIIVFGAAVICRLFFLQIIKHDYYLAMALGQRKIFSQTQGERGEIFFRGGEKLAGNEIKKFAYLSPRETENKEETAKILSLILSLEETEIIKKLENDNSYELLKTKLTDNEQERLERLKIKGLYIKDEQKRAFPLAKTASQVIGFVNQEGEGQYGLEGFYQKILEGKEGLLEGEMGAKGFLISLLPNKESKNGSNILLTLDYQIQFKAEKLLEEAKKNLEFDSATIIVIDPNSGEIFALANLPNFDPNNYEKEKNLAIFQNSAVQKIFEPGSVFKPITMASAIEEEKITPQTIYIDEGVVKIGGLTVYNYDNRIWGERTMTEVLEKSINTGAVFAEQQLGNDLFLRYLEKFGFFEKTGVDLQGEVFSQNKEFKKGYDINFATASFGQGIEITPIQLVRAFSAIANGGKLVKPYLAKKIVDENGAVSAAKEILPELSKNIISEKTSAQVVSMMTSVIENGFGKKAKIPGYFVAGKTGTAQVSWSALRIDKRGYSDKTVQSFIGFAPAFDPRFLILVKLDNPKTNTAEYSALPIFHDLAKYIIDLWQIPPDYEQ